MVKITNEFGDVLKGTLGNAIYQTHYGTQIRRKGYKEDKKPSVKQVQQRKRFKDAIAWAKNLPFEDRQSLKILYQTTDLSYNKKYPVNWWNFAKLLYIKPVQFELLDITNNKFKINHPALLSVKEYSPDGTLLYSDDNLSSFDSPFLDQTYIRTPRVETSKVEINLLTGLQNIQMLSTIITELICGEIECCDPSCVE